MKRYPAYWSVTSAPHRLPLPSNRFAAFLTAAKRRHEADRDLLLRASHIQRRSPPAGASSAWMMAADCTLLFDGSGGSGEHGADRPCASPMAPRLKLKPEVPFELLLHLADALVELTTLQSDIAQQISPIWLWLTVSGRAASLGGGDALHGRCPGYS